MDNQNDIEHDKATSMPLTNNKFFSTYTNSAFLPYLFSATLGWVVSLVGTGYLLYTIGTLTNPSPSAGLNFLFAGVGLILLSITLSILVTARRLKGPKTWKESLLLSGIAHGILPAVVIFMFAVFCGGR